MAPRLALITQNDEKHPSDRPGIKLNVGATGSMDTDTPRVDRRRARNHNSIGSVTGERRIQLSDFP